MTITAQQAAPANTTNATMLCSLPAQPLLAAAQFASTDHAKLNLQRIQISRDGDNLIARATNGFIAFRCCIPNALAEIHEAMGDEIQLAADGLRKHETKAVMAQISSVQTTMLDSKGAITAIRPVAPVEPIQYPNIDNLWPDRFTFDPGKPLTVDIDYIDCIVKTAKRLGADKIRQSFNSANTWPDRQRRRLAIVYRAEFDIDKCSLAAEFLLMPIMTRDLIPENELESTISSFNAIRPDQREGLTARLEVKAGVYAVNFVDENNRPAFSAPTLSQAKAIMLYLAGGSHAGT